MMTVSPKTKKPATTKKVNRRADSTLAICPVNGAGWCPYPFTVSQLKKRLKKIQAERQQAEMVSGKS